MSWRFPEMRRFRSRDEAQEVVKEFKAQWVNTLTYSMAMVASLAIGTLIMVWSGRSSSYFIHILGILALFAIPFFVGDRLTRKKWQQFLRQQLNARGIPICMKCAYDLTGNTSGVCPECGTETERP